jgi:hypothetical protein
MFDLVVIDDVRVSADSRRAAAGEVRVRRKALFADGDDDGEGDDGDDVDEDEDEPGEDDEDEDEGGDGPARLDGDEVGDEEAEFADTDSDVDDAEEEGADLDFDEENEDEDEEEGEEGEDGESAMDQGNDSETVQAANEGDLFGILSPTASYHRHLALEGKPVRCCLSGACPPSHHEPAAAGVC